MFIFSKNQFEKLMGYSAYHKGNNLLDLGKCAPIFFIFFSFPE